MAACWKKRDYIRKTYTDEHGVVSSLEEKEKTITDKFVADSIAQQLVFKEAGYKGKTKTWSNYIAENLVTPDWLMNTFGKGKYQVSICFLISKQDNTDDMFLTKSCEWSADEEVLRIIKESPKWQPATRNSKPVNFWQIQQVTFQVSE